MDGGTQTISHGGPTPLHSVRPAVLRWTTPVRTPVQDWQPSPRKYVKNGTPFTRNLRCETHVKCGKIGHNQESVTAQAYLQAQVKSRVVNASSRAGDSSLARQTRSSAA